MCPECESTNTFTDCEGGKDCLDCGINFKYED